MHRPRSTRLVISFNRSGAGLGNRLRAVLGAKSLADLEGRGLAYVWPTGPEFGPRLTDLWDFRAPVIPRALSRSLAPIWPYRDHTLDWIDDERRAERIWQIRTPHALALPAAAVPWEEQLRGLRPDQEVAERVVRIFDQHLRGRPYVGVMVRTHARSHAKTLQTSPVEWFVERMHQIRAAEPDIGFFVSCDTHEASAHICSVVPGTVTQTDKGEYNSVSGVRAAVADLYLLASSGMLLGPHWSSFVEVADALAAGKVPSETPMETRHPGQLITTPVDDPVRPWVR